MRAFAKIVVVALCSMISVQIVTGQDDRVSISSLEAGIDEIYGLEKVRALNRLTAYYSATGERKAIRYGKQSVALAETLVRDAGSTNPNEIRLLVNAYQQLAEAQYNRETYFEARRNFEEAEAYSAKIQNRAAERSAQKYLAIIDSLVADGTIKQSFFSKTFGNAGIGEAITSVAQGATIETEIIQGQTNEKKGEFEDAIRHYSAAANLLKNTGDEERISSLQIKISALYDSLGMLEEAQQTMVQALAEAETEVRQSSRSLQVIPQLPNQVETRVAAGQGADVVEQDERDLQSEKRNLKEIADKLAREKDYEKSLAYYQLYQDLSQRMYEDSVQTELERENRQREIMLLSQQKQIADLKLEAAGAEQEKQNRLRHQLMIVAGGILLLSLIIFYFYISKRREHEKLVKAYDDLERTKIKLEDAEQRIVTLLSQQLSGEIANELITQHGDHPAIRRFVCIMFLDIRDFTAIAETMRPEDLIIYQNNIFSMMIDIVQKYHGNINQLLGDGFMATFGAPISHDNDCQNAFNAAREILKELKEKIDAETIPPTRIGIGLHAGHVVTGNVGSEKRKQYSITGNAVIIASRVEQLNKKYKSQLIITEDVYKRLEQPLALNQPFLEVTVKGRTQPVKILKIA